MNTLQRFEYVTLRLIRRFVVTEKVARKLPFLPYFRASINERKPEQIVGAYQQQLESIGETIANRRVLEAGSGRTLMVPYALVNAGAMDVIALEPFVEFDNKLNEELLSHHAALAPMNTKVRRVEDLTSLEPQSIDVLLSNSVLEHVEDPQNFFADCFRVLAPSGIMLHIVDYRDHFFKYPYAFLTFSRRTWNRWLNPGDLPRWRIYDHITAMREVGFEVTILERSSEPEAYSDIHKQLDIEFASEPEGLKTTQAVLFARKSATELDTEIGR